MIKFQLISTKKRTRLTLAGKILVLLIMLIPAILMFRGVNRFLSPTHSIPSKLLTIEGFLPDYTLKEMIAEFYAGDYDKIIITGKPMGQGYYISGYFTDADLMKSTLIKMGVDSSKIISISIPENVYRDRTYTTGLLLSDWISKNQYPTNTVNLYTLGCHARRSQLMFKMALGDDFEVGVIAGKDLSYDRDKWWKSSKGFRTVISETIAFVYARWLFYPDHDQALADMKAGYFIDKIQYERNAKDLEFAKEGSPLTEEQRQTFVQLKYFPPDPGYKVKGIFVKDTITHTFEMKTSTDRLPVYATFGKIYFKIDTTECVLSAYQNMELVKRPGYEDYLFIPFRDLSCGEQSYGGGRYLDFRYQGTDTVYLDFNLAYNPLCAYNHKYSCPIPPYENHLNVSINAGEKKYEEH